MTPDQSKLVRDHLWIAQRMSKRMHRPGHLALADLEQEGSLGLMRAADPGRGLTFVTYASWWVRAAIGRAIANKGREVRVPVHVLDLSARVERLRLEFAAEHGRTPDDEEIAHATGVKVAKLRPSLLRLVSPEVPLKDESPRPDELVEGAEIVDVVAKVIDRLPPIQADVLRRRFGLHDGGEPMTLAEIGERYSLSRERIRQLQEQALGAVRRKLHAAHG